MDPQYIQPSFSFELDGVFRVYRKYFKGLWFFCFLVNMILTGWMQWLYIRQMKRVFGSEQELLLSAIHLGVDLLIIYPLIQNACHQLWLKHVQNPHTSMGWKQIIRMSFRNSGKIFVANGLLSLFLLLFFLLFGSIIYTNIDAGNMYEKIAQMIVVSVFLFSLPLSFIFIRFALIIPVISVEQKSIGQAFQRSWELTRGRYWLILGRLILLFIVTVPIQIGWGMLLRLTIESGLWFQWIAFVLTLAILPLFLPLVPLMFSLIYWDERVRKEALDLQFRLKSERGEE
ncbi:glycerophosphoryl diester phosphodiesterase membrane domain-containing protein [Thermoflavimicrobium dichotomicum]|uniref:Membrane domain of glycerophosphoryl diester phosphodiesterase n=1 Tax=Thermoflavimicrobium dichotomicum TaxID=46223 RepID=A0A1I3RUD1_9BACL|nr:glycerophosphoryl diester phosphodiesterase membrane domain-containing protein [Thermoflavimicrobium dichotomicum]SFJ49965.1 Membrane domain of glycerophosphoryl diester phosphodiesterase [Thermoflavimicrobium dichotomicum]